MNKLIMILLFSFTYAAEMKQDVILTINGKEHIVSEGTEIKIGNISVSASVSKTKTFYGVNYKFMIPSDFALEKDESDKDCIKYTFDGKNVIAYVFELSPNTDGDEFIKAMMTETVKVLKVNKSNIIDAPPLRILNQEISGKQLILPIGETITNQMLYSFQCGQQKIILTLQRSDDKEDVEEYNEVIKMLSKSFSESKK